MRLYDKLCGTVGCSVEKLVASDSPRSKDTKYGWQIGEIIHREFFRSQT